MFILLLGLNSCDQFNARSAVKVNDEVIAKHKELMLSLEAFISALDERDGSEIESTLEVLKANANEGLKATGAQQSPKCNSTFLPAAEEMFKFYSTASDNEYAAIAELYGRDSISYSEYDSLQLIIQKVESAQEKTDREFLDAQQSFARSCGFKLVRNVE